MSRSAVRFALALVAVFVAAEIQAISARDKEQGAANGGQGARDKGQEAAERSAATGASDRTAVERAFEKQVSVKLRDTPLKEAAAYLSDLAGVNVLLDKKALADAGIQEDLPITFEMSDVSLGAALRALLAEHGLGFAIPADNVLSITTADAAREHLALRVYDVKDLLEPPAAGGEFSKEATPGDASSVIELVTTCIEPTSWTDSGGSSSIVAINAALVVSSTVETQGQIAGLFGGLRTVRAEERAGREPPPMLVGSGPAEEKIRQQLERRQDFDFYEIPLSELVDYLRAQGLPVSVDQKRLADTGIALDMPVSFAAKQVPLKFALRTLFKQHELGYILRDEALVITSDVAMKEHVRVGIYPVADLLDAKPGDRSGDLDFDGLIDLITSVVAPTSWGDAGGTGQIVPLMHPTVIVLVQTEEVHEQIADLLAKLRAARPGAKESAAAKAPAEADHAMVVRIHHVANVADAALDQYIAAIRHLVEPNEWGKEGRYIGKVRGGIAVRNIRAAQERIAQLIAQIDAAPLGGSGGGFGGGGGFKGGGAF